MKTLLLTLSILSVLSFSNSNCQSKSAENTLTQPAKNTGNIQVQDNDSLYRQRSVIKVSGKVFFTSPYCGGARPTEEILAETKKLHQMTSSTILLVSDENPSKKINIKTGSDGTFNCNLQAGSYSYYMTNDFNKTIGIEFSSSDPTIRDMKFGSLNVSDNMSEPVILVFHFICGPETRMRP